MSVEEIVLDLIDQIEALLKEEDVTEPQADCLYDAITVLYLSISEDLEDIL